jgi:protoheme ferro-lyase
LTVIDFFSKRVFAKPLLNAQSESIRDALEEICEENNTFPLILQTDNGSEFKKNVREWCLENNIKQVKTLSHTFREKTTISNEQKLQKTAAEKSCKCLQERIPHRFHAHPAFKGFTNLCIAQRIQGRLRRRHEIFDSSF